MLCSLTEGDTYRDPLLCFYGKFKTSAFSLPSKSTISSPSGMYPSSSKLELQLSPRGKRLFQISAFPAWGEGSRAHHSRCVVTAGGRTGLSSSPSSTRLLFLPFQPLSQAGGCCPGLGRTKLLRATTSSNPSCLYSAIAFMQQAEWETLGLSGKMGGGSQPGVTRRHRFNGVGQQVWAPLQALVSPADAPAWHDGCGWPHSIPAHQPASPPRVCPAICSQQLRKCFSEELIWKARGLSTNVAAQLYGIKESRQCAHSRGNCAMGTTVSTLNLFYNSVRQIWNSCSVCSSFPVAMSFFFYLL